MDDADVAFRDRAVYLPEADAVVIADLHLGREAVANVEFPLGEPGRFADRLGDLIDAFGPAEVVLAGDVLHSFSTLPLDATDALDELRRTAEARGVDVILVAGNHDAMLEEVDEPVAEYRLQDGTVVCHGHEVPESDADRYVVGHDHPAIVIEGRRRPCFLLGDGAFDGADVVCLPAFDRLAAGAVVNDRSAADVRSPLLADLPAFRPVVRDDDADETYTFPPLGELRRLL